MTTLLIPPSPRLLLRGIHLSLTAALRSVVEAKTIRLFRHEPQLLRIRVDLEHDRTRGPAAAFVAKGHLEVRGNDLLASVATEDCYKSIDLLVDRLDGMLRRRAQRFRGNRHDLHAIDLPVPLPKTDR
jgi:putative sigma-54 modulation protein